VLAIAWRNPTPVHITRRCLKFGKDILNDIYVVQELCAGAGEEQWATKSVLEVICSGHVEAACVQHHVSEGSRTPGAKSHEPAAS
jgi:hypothetical protein